MGNGRTPQNIAKVPFKQVVQLKLGNKVNKIRKEDGGPICIAELSVLLACFKNSTFKDQACSEEVKKFYACYNAHKEKQSKSTMRQNKLSNQGVRELLKKFSNQ